MNEMIDRHLIFLKTWNKNLLITQTQLETWGGGGGGGQLGTAELKLTLDHRKSKKIADIHSGDMKYRRGGGGRKGYLKYSYLRHTRD
jgi:hypothetical protein